MKDICHGIFKLKDGGVSFDICSGVVYELYYHPHLVERAVEGVFKGVHASGKIRLFYEWKLNITRWRSRSTSYCGTNRNLSFLWRGNYLSNSWADY